MAEISNKWCSKTLFSFDLQNTYPVLDYTDFDENLDFTPNKRIPLKLLKQLQGIETVDDLFDKLIEPGQRYKRRSVKSTFESVKRIGRRLRKSGKTLRNITEGGGCKLKINC